MNKPKVSIIIPAYNGADLLGEAIQSVLDQTYPHFELIVVDDLSPDPTAEIVGRFDDSRLVYLRHEENQGAVAARETGIKASSGNIIAFLDQDDLYHPDKLEIHVEFLLKHPEVGVTYNGRFNLDGSSRKIVGMWQPPQNVTLKDIILGFPFAPSDTVIRREWALESGIWDSLVVKSDGPIFNGAEYVYCGRLYLAGCKFASVGRVLNYRRYYPERVHSNLEQRCESERACQEIVFSDPRCSPDILALSNVAYANTYLDFAFYAFAQDEAMLGHSFLHKAAQLNPSLLKGEPSKLLQTLVLRSFVDVSRDHENLLQCMFTTMPRGGILQSDQFDWAIAHGYLLRGASASIWGRFEEGHAYFERALELEAEVDESFVSSLAHQLLEYEAEFGAEKAHESLGKLALDLGKVGGRRCVRQLKARYSFNRAFQRYQAGVYRDVPREVTNTLINDPRYLTNRGILSILLRSTFYMPRTPKIASVVSLTNLLLVSSIASVLI